VERKRLKLLEQTYEAEINAALCGHKLRMMQTKSALAEALVKEGFLAKCQVVESGVTIEGYELTHAGRMAYCASVDQGRS
jgi:hypothetical protein